MAILDPCYLSVLLHCIVMIKRKYLKSVFKNYMEMILVPIRSWEKTPSSHVTRNLKYIVVALYDNEAIIMLNHGAKKTYPASQDSMIKCRDLE